MNSDLKLTVIIPTTAEATRSASLERAIHSIKQQSYIQANILLIVNGNIFDKELFALLQKRNDLEVLYLDEGNLPKAIYFGVLKVTTPFFCFLDDDDCYIEDTLHQRLQPMLDDQTIDFVVSRGFKYINGKEILVPGNFPTDPINAPNLMLQVNWLASCGGTYRKSTIDAPCFDKTPKYAEWSYIGFLLATTRKGFFLSIPSFKIYDSNDSLSKSSEYTLGLLAGIKKMILISPRNLKLEVKIKYGKALHNLSAHYLSHGDILNAIKFHLFSLFQPRGYLYLTYSRKILLFQLQRLFNRPI